jgi:hypothetical protein
VWERVAGVLIRPRRTMAEVVSRPDWACVWLSILVVWGACGTWLLSSPVGRQALVDERVRVVEAFGGAVDAAEYTRLQAHPPLQSYFTSGGRLLLAPPVTLMVAAGLWLASRRQALAGGFRPALAVGVYATVVLVVEQIVATPFHLVRESLISPFNLAAVLPGLDEGTLPARILGTIDLFALWWLGLLALGAAALLRQPARKPFAGLLAAYVGTAIVLAVVQAASGGI